MTTDLRALFRQFADAECRTEPLYAELCAQTAHDQEILALLDVAADTQRRPNLLLAAVHYLLLKGIPHPLARYYPSVGGTTSVDANTFPAFRDFCIANREALHTLIATRATQTNEVGRCVVLLPILQQIAALRERPLALIDVGCSAGLNLGVDLYRYEYATQSWGPPDAQVRLHTREIGGLPIPLSASVPSIGAKIGMDIDPVDLFDEDSVLWLRACLWPSDVERATRFSSAVATMRKQPLQIVQGDVTRLARDHAVRHARNATVVILNSWVMTYFDAELRSRYTILMEELVREQDVFWIAAEAPGIVARAAVPPLPPDSDAEIRNATLWSVCYRQHNRSMTYRTLARSHGHGAWVQWTAPDPLT